MTLSEASVLEVALVGETSGVRQGKGHHYGYDSKWFDPQKWYYQGPIFVFTSVPKSLSIAHRPRSFNPAERYSNWIIFTRIVVNSSEGFQLGLSNLVKKARFWQPNAQHFHKILTCIVLPKCWPPASADKAPVKLAMVLLTSVAWKSLQHSPTKSNLHWNARPKPLQNPMFWNKECLSVFPGHFLYSMATSHIHHKLCFSGRVILPDPWLLLQGDFAVRQQLLSDCVDSDGHDPPAKATAIVVILLDTHNVK